MAENEEDFTKDFMANLMGAPKEPPTPQSSKGRGAFIKSNPGGMRAATPPGLRSVPKAPTCWACNEQVEMGMKILKIKGIAWIAIYKIFNVSSQVIQCIPNALSVPPASYPSRHQTCLSAMIASSAENMSNLDQNPLDLSAEVKHQNLQSFKNMEL